MLPTDAETHAHTKGKTKASEQGAQNQCQCKGSLAAGCGGPKGWLLAGSACRTGHWEFKELLSPPSKAPALLCAVCSSAPVSNCSSPVPQNQANVVMDTNQSPELLLAQDFPV